MAQKLMKDDIINSVVDKTGLSKKDAGAAVRSVHLYSPGCLEKRQFPLVLSALELLKSELVQPREGRNPQTGEALKIPKKKVPAFKAGKKLKDAVS